MDSRGLTGQSIESPFGHPHPGNEFRDHHLCQQYHDGRGAELPGLSGNNAATAHARRRSSQSTPPAHTAYPGIPPVTPERSSGLSQTSPQSYGATRQNLSPNAYDMDIEAPHMVRSSQSPRRPSNPPAYLPSNANSNINQPTGGSSTEYQNFHQHTSPISAYPRPPASVFVRESSFPSSIGSAYAGNQRLTSDTARPPVGYHTSHNDTHLRTLQPHSPSREFTINCPRPGSIASINAWPQTPDHQTGASTAYRSADNTTNTRPSEYQAQPPRSDFSIGYDSSSSMTSAYAHSQQPSRPPGASIHPLLSSYDSYPRTFPPRTPTRQLPARKPRYSPYASSPRPHASLPFTQTSISHEPPQASTPAHGSLSSDPGPLFLPSPSRPFPVNTMSTDPTTHTVPAQQGTFYSTWPPLTILHAFNRLFGWVNPNTPHTLAYTNIGTTMPSTHPMVIEVSQSQLPLTGITRVEHEFRVVALERRWEEQMRERERAERSSASQASQGGGPRDQGAETQQDDDNKGGNGDQGEQGENMWEGWPDNWFSHYCRDPCGDEGGSGA